MSEICSLGVEPNPAHSTRLKQTESSYRSCGWPVTFLTSTAASDHAGRAAFYSDGDAEHLEWGGSIIATNRNLISRRGDVRVLRLADLILRAVVTRRLPRPPDPNRPPALLLKLDVEGKRIATEQTNA